jgi:exopolysaccharide production protein ExoY
MGKRFFDILFSFLVFFIAAPLFILCAVCVKLSSRGPVFYSHIRVGRGGRLFSCFKFRTMYQDADARLQPLLASDPALMQEWQKFFKLKADPRITPIGRILRKTSLDELPQILNVLKGEMSVVGPRPLTEYEVDYYLKEKAQTILSLRPGLTSLWIVQGRNRLSLKQRIDLEEQYVKNRSFWMDIKLIFMTAYAMIFPKDAY